jgi:pimeloyl-ACP methyl ester carboxylesterase
MHVRHSKVGLVLVCGMLLLIGTSVLPVRGQPTVDEDVGVLESELSQSSRGATMGGEYGPDELFDASGGNLRSYLGRHELPNGLYTFSIDVDRWFSPLITTNEPLSPAVLARLIEQGILPETATLVMQVYDVDHENRECAEVDHLYINGSKLMVADTPVRLTSGNNTSDVLSFDVPISMLKFATDPGNTGSRPKSLNEIAIDVNVLECGIGGNAGTRWQVQVNWATLAIKAPIRPVVLVHGWTSNKDVWRDDDHMVNLLATLGFPYAYPIDYENGTALTSRWIRLLQDEVDRVRTNFGVDKVSIIAHSRGGLIARLALEDTGFARKVDALVTLGSPHHGTTYGELSQLIGNPSDPKYDAALTMSRTYVRIMHNFDCDERFRPIIFLNCKPIYKRAPLVRYYSIAEGDRQDKAANSILLVDDREATYPWNNPTPPFPERGNVDHIFLNFDHSELARERESHCRALAYIASFVASTPECAAALLTVNSDEATLRNHLAQSTLSLSPTLVFTADALTYTPGTTATVAVALHDGSDVVPGAQISGELLVVDGNNLTLSFVDTGNDGDEVAGDGIFVASFPAPAEVGIHGIMLNGVSGATSFQALETILVAKETASYNRIVRTQANDLDQNQLYDELVITTRIRLNQAAHVRVTGELVDADGSTVALGSYSTSLWREDPLSSGLWDIPLTFDGRDIRNSGRNGPYTLAKVTIFDETSVSLPVHTTATTHKTSDYRASQFEGALLSLIESSDSVADADGNGRYDELAITLKFNPALPGTYRWSGRLVNQRGEEIGWAGGSGTLDVTTPLTIVFEGKRIGNSELNGPYLLRDLSLTQTRGGAVQVFFEDIYTTSDYRAEQFESDPRRLYLPLLKR